MHLRVDRGAPTRIRYYAVSTWPAQVGHVRQGGRLQSMPVLVTDGEKPSGEVYCTDAESGRGGPPLRCQLRISPFSFDGSCVVTQGKKENRSLINR